MLRLDRVCTGYRKLQVLHDVSLRVEEGEIVSLIGANGAGKTTTLRVISGLLPVRAGTIEFAGGPIGRYGPHRLARAGLVHVPQGRAIFGPLTVRENLLMGAYTRDASERPASMSRVFEIFPLLSERGGQRADTLSGGQQQMLAIGRALMARPRLLTLDEPSLGLAPNLVSTVFQAVRRIRADGVTVLLVEQNAVQSLRISDRAYVLESGRIALTGTGTELIENSQVRTAYLGR
ncbi:MAG: ABC transporter ATP-binding protein [Streptosporangiaceae bacterium]